MHHLDFAGNHCCPFILRIAFLAIDQAVWTGPTKNTPSSLARQTINGT
jgi:hypothetical protein